MAHIQPTRLLRYALYGDALASGATGLLLAGAGGLLADLLGYPAPFLRWVGIILLPYAALVAFLGSRPSLPRGVVLAVVILNAMWVVDSLIVLSSRGFTPTGLGIAFVLLQAAVVAGFALAQWTGLKASVGVERTSEPAHA